MIDEDDKKLLVYVSPSYIAENKLDTSLYTVNIYALKNFEIETYSKDIVAAKIWGSGKKWIHRLYFHVVIENKKYYLLPSKHSKTYITLWHNPETFLKEQIETFN